MKREITSLKRSLGDSEQLLLDANKRGCLQTQQVHTATLEADQFREENIRLSADSLQLKDTRAQLLLLQQENKTLNKELVRSLQHLQVNFMLWHQT